MAETQAEPGCQLALLFRRVSRADQLGNRPEDLKPLPLIGVLFPPAMPTRSRESEMYSIGMTSDDMNLMNLFRKIATDI